MGKSRCIPGSPGDYFKLLVKQEFQATCKIMGLRPRINLENGEKVTHNGRLLIKWAVAKVSAIFWRSRDLLEVLKIWRSLDKKRKTTKREDRIMVRKACPITLRLHRKIKAEMQIERGESVSTSTTRWRLREARPNDRKPSYYLHHKWAVLFDRQCYEWLIQPYLDDFTAAFCNNQLIQKFFILSGNTA